MAKVLIAKANEELIKSYLPKVEFIENTKNTSVFKISGKTLSKLIDKVREDNYNPFALLYWQ
jgi:hypothetical protein